MKDRGSGKPNRAEKGQFRGAVSTYDKREVIQKQRALKAKKVNKFKRTLARLAAEGRLPAPAAVPRVDDDPLLLGGGSGLAGGGGRGDRRQQEQGEHEPRHGGGQQQRRRREGRAPHPVAPPSGDELEGSGSDELSGAAALQRQALPPPPVRGVQPGTQPPRPLPQQQQQQQQQQQGQEPQGGSREKGRGKARHPSHLERLAAKRQTELQQERAEAEARQKEAQRRREEMEGKERQRKASKAKFFAKTKRGQPVMRHRLDKMLEALQSGG